MDHHADIVDLTIQNDDDDDDEDSKPIIIERSANNSPSHPKPQSTSATSNANANTTAATAKPRSTKAKHQRASPSPSPPPQQQHVPLQTIRLEIKLGGPDNYAIDIADISKATGQRLPTPVRTAAPGVSDSEDEDESKATGDASVGKPKKKKKKNPAYEHYDTSDPFIDDSELAIDERTFFAQTKQTGFYVSSGEVALLKDKTPKKPKSSKNPLHASGLGTELWRKGLGTGTGKGKGLLATGGPPKSGKKDLHNLELPSSTNPEGIGTAGSEEETKHGDLDDELANTSMSAAGGRPVVNGANSASAMGAEATGGAVDTARTGEKRKRYITVVEGGKKRKVIDVHSFHPRLQEEVENLRAAISKENWDQKGKFPPSLKPHLAKLALLAIELDEYDDHFFNLMPTLFPYNKFTMSKLIKRTVFQEHTELLMERQEALLSELTNQAKAGFAKAEEEWEKSVLAWDKRQEKLRLEGGATGGTGADSAAPTRHPTEEMDVDTPGDGHKDKDKDRDKEQQPPGKRYRLTETMKAIVWQLVLLSNECCRLENEKNTLEGSVIQVSEQGLRKALYQKIVAAFPEGWLSSGQISRDVSSMKKRYEKEAMEQENEQDY